MYLVKQQQQQHSDNNLGRAYVYNACHSLVPYASCVRQSVLGERGNMYLVVVLRSKPAHGLQKNFLKLYAAVKNIYFLIV